MKLRCSIPGPSQKVEQRPKHALVVSCLKQPAASPWGLYTLGTVETQDSEVIVFRSAIGKLPPTWKLGDYCHLSQKSNHRMLDHAIFRSLREELSVMEESKAETVGRRVPPQGKSKNKCSGDKKQSLA